MGRLADKFGKVNDAIAGVEMMADRHVDAIIERTKEVQKKLEIVALRKHMRLDGQMSDIVEFDKDLDEELKNDRSRDGENSKDGDAYVSTRTTSK